MTDLHSFSFPFLIAPRQLTPFYLPIPRCLAARAALLGFGLCAICPPGTGHISPQSSLNV